MSQQTSHISVVRHFDGHNNSSLVVFSSTTALTFINGYAEIQILYGEILCAGAKLTAKKKDFWVSICSTSVLGPPVSIKNVTGSNSGTSALDKKQLRERLKQFCSDAVANEIFSDFHPARAYVVLRPIKENWWNLKLLEKTFKTLFSSPLEDSLLVLPTLRLYSNQKENNGRKEICKETLLETTTQPAADKQVFMAVGPTGIGKSTFLRCLLNGYLSETTTESPIAYYLDLDLGQPEFTPPGCVSLSRLSEPKISPPFFHLSKPLRSYFVGSTNYASNQQIYLKSVSRLLQDFNEIAESTAVLFVNTAGWIHGMGYDIMACLIQLIKPTEIIELQFNDDGVETVESHFTSKLVQSTFEASCQLGLFPPELPTRHTCPLAYQLSVMTIRKETEADGHNDMISRDVRDLALMSYFCQDLTAETSTLMGLKPLVAPFNSVGVSIFSDQLSCLPLPDQHIMAVLNASLVALCSCSPENILDQHFNEDLNMPMKIAQEATPLWLGFGLLRGIDMKRKEFLLVTPLPTDELASVNSLFKGSIEVPSAVFSSQSSLPDCPYLTRQRKEPEGTAQPAVTKTARFRTRRMKRRYNQTS